jgi:hypothetical protein
MKCGKTPHIGVSASDLATLGHTAIPLIVQRAAAEHELYLRFHLLEIVRAIACRGQPISTRFPDAVDLARQLADSASGTDASRATQLYEDLRTDCSRMVVRPR